MSAGGVENVIVARDVAKHFAVRAGLFGRRALPPIRAVDGVSFAIPRGSCFAIVGESGSGKSTLARLVVGLLRPTGGEVRLDGEEVAAKSAAELRQLRRRVQLVLQDPLASLDPRMTVRATLEEALVVHDLHPGAAARRERVETVIRQVGLALDHLERFPNALSGGQRQRVAIARAIICEPEVLVLDEPVSALDVSVQAQIINLLMELQAGLRLTYVIITHDLSLVGHMADAVGVMYLGRFVELGPAAEVVRRPLHPYTESLLSSVAGVDPEIEKSRPVRVLEGAIPSASAIPTGCSFHTRCPRAREIAPNLAAAERTLHDGEAIPTICATCAPPPQAIARDAAPRPVTVTCHFADDAGRAARDTQSIQPGEERVP
jgi:oligopeptide/dipeptide ABC transporter ATP-binding protein